MFAALRIGRRLKSSGRVFVFLGVIFLGFFALGVGAIEGTYQGMADREFLRSPGFEEAGADATAIEPDSGDSGPSENGPGDAEELGAEKGQGKLRLLWIPSWGVEQVHGYMLEPHAANAPLPPGMSKWLEPGQVVVSPALAKQYPPGSQSPFGHVVGRIPIDALSNPTELFFYARPTGPLPNRWGTAVDSFAGTEQVINGDSLNQQPKAHSLLFLIAFLAFPGIMLCATGLFQAFSLRESSTLLKDIGIGLKARFACGVGTMLRPITIATALIAVAVAITCVKPIPLPLVNVTLYPPDLQQQLPLTIGVYALLLLIVVIASGLNAWFALPTGPVKKLRKVMVRISQILVLPALIFVWVFANMGNLHGLVLQIVFFGAVLSLGLSIPTISLWIAELIAALLYKLKPTAVTIVAHRKLRAHSSSLMISLLGVSLTLVSLGAIQLYTSQLAGPMQQALHVQKVLGNQILEIKIPSFTLQEAQQLSKTLSPHGGSIITSMPQGNNGTVLLQADRQATTILQLPHHDTDKITTDHSDHKTALAIDMIGGDSASLRTHLPPQTHLSALYLVSDKNLNLEQVSKTTTAYGVIASPLANDWLGAVKMLADQVNWFILFGLPAALALIAASLTASSQQAKKRLQLQEIVTVYSLPTRPLITIVGLIVFNPLLWCALLSYLAYSALTTGFALHFQGTVITSPAFQITLLVAGILGALYNSTLIYRAAKK